MADPKSVDIDMAAVKALAADLKMIRQRLAPAMRNATSASAMAIRNQARQNWKSQTTGSRTRKYPSTITMQVTVSNASLVVAEVGPEKGGLGSFGHLFEFGNSKSPGKPHLIPAWEAQQEPYVLALALAAQDAVLS